MRRLLYLFKTTLLSSSLIISIYPDLLFAAVNANCQNSFEDNNAKIFIQTKLSHEFANRLNEGRILENLEKITGIKPILENNCVKDRCEERNKDIFRLFLLSYLENLQISKEAIFFEFNKHRFSWNELELELKNSEEQTPQAPTLIPTENSALWQMMETIIDSFGLLLPTNSPPFPPAQTLSQAPNIQSNEVPEFLKKWLRLKDFMRRKSSGNGANSQNSINIIVEYKGKIQPSKIIELNAHYDTVYTGVPGADDNGSGTVLLLESLSLLKDIQTNKTIRLVFADHEERGFIGTRNHVDLITEKKEDVEAALVIDMFAYHPETEPSKHFVVEISDDRISNNATVISNNRNLANTFFNQSFAFPRHAQPLFTMENALPGTADHGPYWRKSVPAILISSRYNGPFINPGYHSSTDTLKNYDFPYFYSIAQQTLEALVRLAEINTPNLEELVDRRDGTSMTSFKEKDWMDEEIQIIKDKKASSKFSFNLFSQSSESLEFHKLRSIRFPLDKEIFEPYKVKFFWNSYVNWLKNNADPSIESIEDSFPKSISKNKTFLTHFKGSSTDTETPNSWFKFTNNFFSLSDHVLQSRDQFLNTSIEISRTKKNLYIRLGSLLLRYFKDSNNQLKIDAKWYSPNEFKNSNIDSLILRLNYLDLEGEFASHLLKLTSKATQDIHFDRLTFELILKYHELADIEVPLEFRDTESDFKKQLEILINFSDQDETRRENIFGIKRSP